MHGDFKFFSMNKLKDWNKGRGFNLDISDEGLSPSSEKKYGISKYFYLSALNEDMSDVMDVAAGTDGLIYILDDKACLWVYDYKNSLMDIVLSEGHGLFTKFAKIEYFDGCILAVDAFSRYKVLFISIATGQVIWSIGEYERRKFIPVAVGKGEDCFYIISPELDRGAADWREEVPNGTEYNVIKISFSGEIENYITSSALRIEKNIRFAEFYNRLHIASFSGRLYIFDSFRNNIYEFDEDNILISTGELNKRLAYGGFCIGCDGRAYVCDSRIIDQDVEDNRYIFSYEISDGPLKQGEALTGFKGRADKLFSDNEGRFYAWDMRSSKFSILEVKDGLKSCFIEESCSHLHGAYISSSFDSCEDGLVWHKVIIDSDIFEDTQIKLYYYCSDSSEVCIDGEYFSLDDFIKDDSIDMESKLVKTSSLWSGPLVNPRDALLNSAVGRYLWVKAEFIASDYNIPALRKLRIYYPRQSYLDYLPGVYQEDEKSRDFLERYLSIFETLMIDLEQKVESFPSLLDADSVPEKYLGWLASWVGIDPDVSWSEKQLRELIKASPELSRMKGTRYALEKVLQIYTGEKPMIVEYQEYKKYLMNPDLSDILTRLYGKDPYEFTVMVKRDKIHTQKERQMVMKIIDEQKPAYTESNLVILEPWIFLDMHSYLGINSYLLELNLLKLEENAALPFDTILIDVERDNMMDTHSRIGMNTELK